MVSTSTARMPKEAIDARITEGLDTDYELYKVIDKNPGQSVYGLAKEMHWSSGRVHGSIRRLEKEGLVHTKRSMQGGNDCFTIHNSRCNHAHKNLKDPAHCGSLCWFI